MSTTPSTASDQPPQVRILVPGNHLMVALLGERDELLRLVEAAFPGTPILVRGNEITIEGDEADRVGRLFEELVVLLQQGHALDTANVGRTIEMVKADERPSEILTADILRSARGRMVRPKTSGQKRYVDAIQQNVVTFGIGPAGTGKSYLAVALACQALQAKQVERIILTRPAVEAGERLGFLPGDLMAKVDPYLRPLYDALFDMLGTDAVPRLMEKGAIEVAPLAYMRGRAQPVDTPVLTPAGFRALGSLRVGDRVIGSDGRSTAVVGVYPQGRKPVYRVTTDDGGSTLACGDHLWYVTAADDQDRAGDGRVVRTVDMIGDLGARREHRYGLPLVRAVDFASRDLGIEPYALGRLLGTGRGARARAAAAPAPGPSTLAAGACTTTPARSTYLYNSVDVRVAVLQGLLDVGGQPAGRSPHGGRVRYTTASSSLRDDVAFLVRSLGGVARVRSRPRPAFAPHGRHGRRARHRGASHVLDIRLPPGMEPFRHPRKAARYTAVGAALPTRYIDRIEAAGEAECVCISVAAADSLYVTSDFLVTHNTLNSSYIILDEAQNTTPEQMKMFLTRIGFGSKAVITGDVTQVDLEGGRSGLHDLEQVLTGIDGLGWVRLGSRDVVRHRIVQDIVDAYERAGQERRR
ncbi:MAG TPA: PhoH family protein [Acidimicrobiales bacterium]|nr:PhoH family protein [Acidimicrobiales bacterium]